MKGTKMMENLTLYERIKGMSFNEMTRFFLELRNRFEETISDVVCGNCLKHNGGECPMESLTDRDCLFDEEVSIKMWLLTRGNDD